jgi:hypothetical protein
LAAAYKAKGLDSEAAAARKNAATMPESPEDP